MRDVWVGAFYNPHLAAEVLAADVRLDHLAMADPPSASDDHWQAIRARFPLLLHDYLGQLSDPLAPHALERARSLAALYDTPWAAEHFQCLRTADGRFSLDYVFPPLYTEEFLDRYVRNAAALRRALGRPLVIENIPAFLELGVPQLPEPDWLARFFEAADCGFLLDLAHLWLEAHYRGLDPDAWLARFPLEHVVEVHIAGVEGDADLDGPWMSAREPDEAMLDLMQQAVAAAPALRAVTFDAFSPALTSDVLFASVERIRSRL